MLSSYRSLLGRPGARGLLLVCALAWLSFSGYGLALILAVHHTTRSYPAAGAAVAAQGVGAAALAPVRGRLVDRHGAAALRLFGAGHAVAGGLLTLALIWGDSAAVFLAAGLLGLTAPPLIAVARNRWAEIAGAELARAGHALNAALSDVAAIAGPAAVGGVGLAISPVAVIPVLVAAASGAALQLAAQLTARQPDARNGAAARGRRRLELIRESPELRAMIAVDLATAAWLSGLELAVIERVGRHGPPQLGALVLGASAAGSIAVSLGAVRLRGRPARRYQAGALLAACVVPLTLLTSNPVVLALILTGVGGAFGLVNVAFYELLDDISPPAGQPRRSRG